MPKAVTFIPAVVPSVREAPSITLRLPGGIAVEASGATELPVEWVSALARSLAGTRPRQDLELVKLGVDAPRARAGAMNNRGPWWNAGGSHMNQAISNNTLRSLGLVIFLDEHRRLERFP